MRKLLSILVLCGLFLAVSAQDMYTNNNSSFAIDSKNMILNKEIVLLIPSTKILSIDLMFIFILKLSAF